MQESSRACLLVSMQRLQPHHQTSASRHNQLGIAGSPVLAVDVNLLVCPVRLPGLQQGLLMLGWIALICRSCAVSGIEVDL
jgi:hypothetical protein